jgi:hypothetical protein
VPVAFEQAPSIDLRQPPEPFGLEELAASLQLREVLASG